VQTSCPSRSIRWTGFSDGRTADQGGDEGAGRGALGGRQQRVHVLGTGFLVVVDGHLTVDDHGVVHLKGMASRWSIEIFDRRC
jgi:hypothetical protein